MSTQVVEPHANAIPHPVTTRANAYNRDNQGATNPQAGTKPLRIKRPVRLRSGPEHSAEKLANASMGNTGHPAGFTLPNGATYFASGPVATAAQPTPSTQPGQAHQLQLQNG
ncbi:MAG: hypothetical protein AAF213_00425 [Pseudomonadota bacterium]